ncbi:MAG TPA: PspA/IM30 family protein [Bryobacteraceae bacterium]|jgi:phage shock protein A
MALLERVATLIRANINELVERAEDPDKMIKQVILDMRNQLLQVKTQVAIAIADEHLLRKKRQEHEDQASEWMRKADLAVSKGEEHLARVCIDKSLSARAISATFNPQIDDQSEQVEGLKSALMRLQRKLAETESQAAILIARHRRSRMLQRASEAKGKVDDLTEAGGTMDQAESKLIFEEALGLASYDVAEPSAGEKVARIEREGEIDKLMAELRTKSAK